MLPRKIFYSPDDCDTFESYFGNVLLDSTKYVVIPYIGFGISEHPINPESKMRFLSKVYAVFKDLDYLVVNGKTQFDNRELANKTYYAMGGINISAPDYELHIGCKEAYLITVPDTYLSDYPPLNYPNGKTMKMSEEEKMNFIESADDMLAELLGD